MKLWLLKARDDLQPGDNPWASPYDKPVEFVVRAVSEDRARQLADGERGVMLDVPAFLDPKYSTCTELSSDGNEAVVLSAWR